MHSARPTGAVLQAAFAAEYARICPGAELPGTWHTAAVAEPEALLARLRRLPEGAGEEAFAEAIAQFISPA